MNQHPLFLKYKREWLHQVTGYSKGLLSRVATGKVPLSRSFIERVCYKLGLPEEELFLPDPKDPDPDIEQETGGNRASMKTPSLDFLAPYPGSVGRWLQEKCQEEHLSGRQAAARTGLSHATIRHIINGVRPCPETIRKLAHRFGNGITERLALEDHLLVMAGYRTYRAGEELSEPLAQLMDKARQLSEPQLKMMVNFADFLVEIEGS